MSEPGRIVVGLNGSPGSLQALRYAVEEARQRRAMLIPVLCWNPRSMGFAGRSKWMEELDEGRRDNAWRRIGQAFDEALGGFPEDLDVHPLIRRGSAKRMLVSVADMSTDLLIIGAGRRGFLRRCIGGSVSRACIARAVCPVIAVPPSELSQELGRGLRPLH